jgi:hypothetical protein
MTNNECQFGGSEHEETADYVLVVDSEWFDEPFEVRACEGHEWEATDNPNIEIDREVGSNGT